MKQLVRYLQEQAENPASVSWPNSRQKQPLTWMLGSESSLWRYGSGWNLPQYPEPHQSEHDICRRAEATTSGRFPLPIDLIRYQYASTHILQSCEVYIPPLSDGDCLPKASKYWLIYLHGGNYCDPSITSRSFHPTLSALLHSPLYDSTRKFIAGYASVNYRLSSHPEHLQDVSKTPDYELRHARSPEHVEDVLTALADLQRRYLFGGRYALIGHSVGATLALQTALSQQIPWTPPKIRRQAESAAKGIMVVPPMGILGVCGIYSLPFIDETDSALHWAISNAIGADPDALLAASPTSYSGRTYNETWSQSSSTDKKLTRRRVLMLAASHADQVVPWDQVEMMHDVFRRQGMDADGPNFIDVKVLETHGKHNDVWEGGGMAHLIAAMIQAVRRIDDQCEAEVQHER